MQNIIIVGAGSFGREVCCWIEDVLDPAHLRIGGFLDDTRDCAPALTPLTPTRCWVPLTVTAFSLPTCL